MDDSPIRFEADGFLEPSEPPILVDLAIFERHFVEPFGASSRRRWLFENFLEFNEKLRREVFPYFEQWIDGSFVGQKAEPNDLDVVTFFDARIYAVLEPKLEPFWANRMEKLGIDSYFAASFEKGDPNFRINEDLWTGLFSKKRIESASKKGFVRLIFEKHIQ